MKDLEFQADQTIYLMTNDGQRRLELPSHHHRYFRRPPARVNGSVGAGTTGGYAVRCDIWREWGWQTRLLVRSAKKDTRCWHLCEGCGESFIFTRTADSQHFNRCHAQRFAADGVMGTGINAAEREIARLLAYLKNMAGLPPWFCRRLPFGRGLRQREGGAGMPGGRTDRLHGGHERGLADAALPGVGGRDPRCGHRPAR